MRYIFASDLSLTHLSHVYYTCSVIIYFIHLFHHFLLALSSSSFFFFFFFQAEDGIRDYKVTGVQTCALPILIVSFASSMGATLAFLSSRFLFREAVRSRFGDRLRAIDAGLEKEGAFYLFALDRKSVV